MTRFERYGLLRALAAGVMLWLLLLTGLLSAFLVVLATGLAVLWAWRLLGDELDRLRRRKAPR